MTRKTSSIPAFPFIPLLAGLALLFSLAPARAYPEFQREIARKSGRAINCAMCHGHPDGPEGAAFGQIGSLTPDQIKSLQVARAAFAPGQTVDNPLLNAFGNHIIKDLGKKKFLVLRVTPDRLADALDPKSDLDRDGIPDAQELRDGTHPLLKSDGRPWLLFRHNFQRNRNQIVLTALATLADLYGLKHLLQGFAIAQGSDSAEEEFGGEDS